MATLPPDRPAPPEAVICPFCGTPQFTRESCSSCKQPMNDRGRRQAQIHMGPWYVRDKSNPFAPGNSYFRMKRLAAEGALTAKSIVRGPSTQQFWLMAKFTPGISHLVGHCFACPAPAKPTDACCSVCRVPFKEYTDRNSLGLRYKTEGEAQAALMEFTDSPAASPAPAARPPASAATEADIPFNPFTPPESAPPKPMLPPQQAVMDADKPDAKPFVPGSDLLGQIFGS